MVLSEICMLEPVSCTAHTTALEAAHTMRHKHVGALVVVDDGEERAAPIGLITDRDIVVEVLAKGLDPAVTLVGSLIRTPVVIANGGMDSSHALELMKSHGVRRLPVVSSAGVLMGIITVDDLLRQVAAEANSLIEIISREQAHEQRGRRSATGAG
jgi:CBS domain-containing protein